MSKVSQAVVDAKQSLQTAKDCQAELKDKIKIAKSYIADLIAESRDMAKNITAAKANLKQVISNERAMTKIAKQDLHAARVARVELKQETQRKRLLEKLAKLDAKKNPLGTAKRRADRRPGPITVVQGV